MIRLLYIGNTRIGMNGDDRAHALRCAGLDVLEFDRMPYHEHGVHVERSVAFRLCFGRGVHSFNADLLDFAEREDFDAVLVDKGVWLWPETLVQLKKAARTGVAIHYTPDAQFLENRSRHFFRGLPEYDLAVTTKDFEQNHYRTAGAREVLLILQGYGRRMFPVPESQIPVQLRSEIAFVGHCQPAYARLLAEVAGRLPLAVWGPRWGQKGRLASLPRGVLRGGGLFGPQYAQALSGAKIAIGLLSKRIPETTTTRSFEIPACGTMLLAERTAAHQALFTEGREAEYFENAEEFCDKAAFYLKNDTARKRIAEAGYRRAQSSGYSVEAQFKRIAQWLFANSATRRRTISAMTPGVSRAGP